MEKLHPLRQSSASTSEPQDKREVFVASMVKSQVVHLYICTILYPFTSILEEPATCICRPSTIINNHLCLNHTLDSWLLTIITRKSCLRHATPMGSLSDMMWSPVMRRIRWVKSNFFLGGVGLIATFPLTMLIIINYYQWDNYYDYWLLLLSSSSLLWCSSFEKWIWAIPERQVTAIRQNVEFRLDMPFFQTMMKNREASNTKKYERYQPTILLCDFHINFSLAVWAQLRHGILLARCDAGAKIQRRKCE